MEGARVSAPLRWDEVPAAELADFTVLTMPARFERIGDPHAQMNTSPGSLDQLLELAARDEAEGLGDAPWPPHFAKAAGEPKRVQPSKAKPFSDQLGEGFGQKRFRKRAITTTEPTQNPGAPGLASETSVSEAAPNSQETSAPSIPASPEWMGSEPPPPTPKPRKTPTKRTPKFPLITISQSPDKAAAEAGLARWRTAHPEASALLAEDDVLVDRMRGTAYVWYRIRLNLRHIPEDQRPAETTPDPDDDPTRAWKQP